jgi:hypothetical protein
LWNEKDEDLVRLCGTHHHELHMVEVIYDLRVEDATEVYLAYKINADLTKVMQNPVTRQVLEMLHAS